MCPQVISGSVCGWQTPITEDVVEGIGRQNNHSNFLHIWLFLGTLGHYNFLPYHANKVKSKNKQIPDGQTHLPGCRPC